MLCLRKLFSRHKKCSKSKALQHPDIIFCDDTEFELKKLITNWMENEYWEFTNFSDFLNLAGVKTPVKLSELDKKSNSFKCVTNDNKEFRIVLVFNDWVDFCSELRIIDGEKISYYIPLSNINEWKDIPHIIICEKNEIVSLSTIKDS